MISLDKNILDKNSVVAKRMIEYGKKDNLFILIPDNEGQFIELSPNVKAYSTGGNKLSQFCRLKKMGRKILKENKINLITAQDPFFTGLAGVCLKKKFKTKLEVQLHGDFFSSDYYKKSGGKNWLQYYIAKLWIIKKADKIRVVGDRIKKSLLDLGIAENIIEARPIAVSVDSLKNYQPKINLRAKYPNYEKIFLNIGRLEPVKNIGWLLEVFAQTVKAKSNYLLLIVGDGSEKEKLQNQVKSLGLEYNIQFESWVDDPVDYIKTADCILFPSLSEGYGLVAMEAAVAGMPLIMNDVGVANFELKPSEKVKILAVNDKAAWLNALLNI